MKKLLCVVACAIAACMDASAMKADVSGVDHTPSVATAARTPMTEWPRYNPISSPEEMEIYKKTWHSENTLEQNLLSLLQRFSDTCCTFFTGTGDFVVRSRGVEVERYKPLAQSEVGRIIVDMQKMALNPVGCKLIRLLLTKYESGAASEFSRLWIVKREGEELFKFGHAYGAAGKCSCILSVADDPRKGSYDLFACGPLKGREIIRLGGSCASIAGFLDFTFFNDNIEAFQGVALFYTMLSWLHLVSGIDIVAESDDAVTKRHPGIKDSYCPSMGKIDDYFFRCISGIVYDRISDAMMMDPLNVNAFLAAGVGVVKVFPRAKIGSWRELELFEKYGDKEMIEFYLHGHAKLPQFGRGQYQCSDPDSRL